MKYYFVDTNIFLRTLIKDEQKSFDECCRFLKTVKLNKVKAASSSLVLAEVIWTLSSYYGFSKEKSIQAVKSILNLRGLKIVDRFQPRISLNLFSKRNVKYIDTLIASIKEILAKKWTVVSYDKDFDKLGVLRKEPGEVIREI